MPTVTFLHERLPDDYLKIASEVYHARKFKAEERIKSVENFLSSDQCTTRLLLEYFEQEGINCGKCKRCVISQEPLPDSDTLLNCLRTEKSLEELYEIFHISDKKSFYQLLHSLLLQEKISESDGKFQSLSKD